jgi:hypothetical protein
MEQEMTGWRKRQISEHMTKDEALKLALEALGSNRRTHHYCEDTWYSCPKHEDGCANDSEGDECNCGADKANAGIDQAITAIKQALAAPVAHRDGYWCVDLTCKKCYGADFRFKHTISPAQLAPVQEPVAWVEYETGNHTKRPQNCGTGYCSCVECVMEPAFAMAVEAKLKEKNT